jgi:chaperonin GroEL (HSP60 family)
MESAFPEWVVLAVVLLAGSLASCAGDLLDDGFHRATVAAGFARAGGVVADSVTEDARTATAPDDPAMTGVARAGLASLFVEAEPGVLDAVLGTIRLLHEAVTGAGNLGLDDVEFEHVPGTVGTVELIRGTVLDEPPISETTPRGLKDAAIAIIGGGRKAGTGIEERVPQRHGGTPGEGRTEVQLETDDFEDIDELRGEEREQVDEQVEAVVGAGADVVFCNMGISDAARALLRAEGVPAFRGLTAGRARPMVRATGARRVMHLADIDASDLGRVGQFRVLTDAEGDDWVRVEDCPDGEVATLLLPDSVEASRAELERDLRAAIVTALDVLQGKPIVPGGGTIEVALAGAVREAARGVGDRTAPVMDAYADALEELPGTLIRNAGADPLAALPALRAGGTERTFDVAAGEVRAVTDDTPHHPVGVVRGTVGTATDLAVRLTRVDGVLAAAEDDEDIIEEPDFTPNVDDE